MKIQIARIVSFIITFVVALIVISAILNDGSTDMTMESSSATLPLVYVNVDGYYVNQMHGYTRPMQTKYLRESLTPLPENRKLYIKIKPFETKVKEIAYEVRSIDGQRLIESATIYDYIDNTDEITGDFDIKDLIERDCEYTLITKLTLDNGAVVNYYTRIIWMSEENAASMISFVKDFHDKTFNKDKSKELAVYLEPNADGDNTNYGAVNINSSVSQVTWGDLSVADIGEENVTILEMDDTTACLMVDSIVNAQTNVGDNPHKVQEYFRLRAGSERTYLLDYDRTMNQYFNPTEISFQGDAISLGITDGMVGYAENPDGNIIMFYQNNALYMYNTISSALSRVYSFYDEDQFDDRTTYDKGNVKIINIDEQGNAIFMYYGYNAKGTHEGEMGISLYAYDYGMNTYEEKIYIPYDKSFALLDMYMQKMTYVNRRNELFIYLDECVYEIDIEAKTSKVIIDSLFEDDFVVSKSNQLIAWQDVNSSEIEQLDLNSGNQSTLKNDGGKHLKLCGYIGEDIVYGECETDKSIFINGEDTHPIKTLKIQDKNNNELKSYSVDGVLISDVEIEDKNIFIKRIKVDDEYNIYAPIDDDKIVYNSKDEGIKNILTLAPTKEYEKVTQISLKDGNTGNPINLQTPNEMMIEINDEVDLEQKEIASSRYYVYSHGKIAQQFRYPEPAIGLASELSAAAIKDNVDYVWIKGNLKKSTQINGISERSIDSESEDANIAALNACVDGIFEYEKNSHVSQLTTDDADSIRNMMEENLNADMLELRGCDLSTILYYLDKGIPVIADAGYDGYLLIIGYDEQNIIVMDPKAGNIHKLGMKDSTRYFEGNGNRYITYIKKI